MFRLFVIMNIFLLTPGITESMAQNAQVKNVSAEDFSKIIKDGKGQLVDIRTPQEYNAGHIKGAVMIDFYSPDFKNKMAGLDRNKPVYIYCRSGNRSSHAAIMLQQLGFKEIVNLKYGITDWQKMGLKLATE